MTNVLAQGHNAVTPVRLEPAAPRSRVKYSSTELPKNLCKMDHWPLSKRPKIGFHDQLSLNAGV